MILVLDDDPCVLWAFRAVLQRMSVPYLGARTIAEAKAALPCHPWLGFVVDLELPDGLGLDFLEWLRTNPVSQHLPAWVATANVLLDRDMENRVLAAGAGLHCGALSRPEIETICRSLLKMSRPVQATI